ncbi:MAG: hypothetical protein H6702_12955 [Myxococcales bacterium]|nr:hypothetical protein [Myxococcales bacterium]
MNRALVVPTVEHGDAAFLTKVVDPAACAQVRAHFQAMCAAGVFARLHGPVTTGAPASTLTLVDSEDTLSEADGAGPPTV